MAFFRDISPRRAGADLIGFLRSEGSNKPLLFILACLPPAIIVATFYFDAMDKATPPPPEVIYFESWPMSRTIEESKAAIAERQKQKDKMLERERDAYKAFGRAVGMDVDAIERKAKAERAAAEKAEQTNEAKSGVSK